MRLHIIYMRWNYGQDKNIKSKRDIKDLLEQIIINENISNEDILERIKKQIDGYE